MFMDEGGFIVEDIHECIPAWALPIMQIYSQKEEKYLAFTWMGDIFVEVFWPDEEVNWYL